MSTPALLTREDARSIARAAGYEHVGENTRVEQLRQRLEAAGVAYLRDRTVTSVPPSWLADRLATIEHKGRTITATLAFGPRQTAQEIRYALSKVALSEGASPEDVNSALDSIDRLSHWAAKAHVQARAKQKRAERLIRTEKESYRLLDWLLSDLLHIWLEHFEAAPDVSRDAPYVRYVKAAVRTLRARMRDPHLSRLTDDDLYQRIREVTPSRTNVIQLSEKSS